MIRAASASPPRTGALTSLSAALGYALEGVGYTANAVIPRPPLAQTVELVPPVREG